MTNNIIKKALISEKSFAKVAQSKYSFLVDNNARKEEIAATCHDLFGVEVLSVNTISIPGKVKKGRKGMGKRSDIKKAIISVKPGQKIDLFETEAETEEKSKKTKKSKKEVVGNQPENK